MPNLEAQAKRNKKMILDLDSMRERYIDIDYKNNIQVTLPAFNIDSLSRSYCILMSSSKIVPFENRWIMRPYYASYDMYNTTIYTPILMWVNKCFLFEEFEGFENIYVPSLQAIFELSKYKEISKTIFPLRPENKRMEKYNKYYKKYSLDNKELQKKLAYKNLTDFNTSSSNEIQLITENITDEFILTSDDITNQYVDLSEIPNSYSGISVYYNNYSIALKYNYDYTLIYDENDIKLRISWKYEDILDNVDEEVQFPKLSGLRNLVEEDDTLKIIYSTTTETVV